MVTVLDGIRAKLSPQTAIHTAPRVRHPRRLDGRLRRGGRRRRANAEVAVVVVGEKSGLTDGCTSGESIDRADLGLGRRAASSSSKRSSPPGRRWWSCLINGRPLALPWIAAHVPAVLEAWVPGEEGGTAVADVLFGDYNPGGKLPISLPVTVGQVPVYYNHKPSGGRSHWKGDYVGTSSQAAVPVRPRAELHALRLCQPDHHSAAGARRPTRCTSAST